MKKKLIIAFFMVGLVAYACIAQNNSTVRSISEALQNIAKKNNAIENVIYDGMTYQEVVKIFEQKFKINWNTVFDNLAVKGYTGISYNGNYIIFWSDGHEEFNPTVLGYSKVGSTDVKHNVLQ